MSHTDEQMEPQGLVAPKVTPAQIAELMKRVTVHHTHGEEPTAYVRADAWLDGSFHLAAAMSKAVNPANFDRQLGVEYSTKDALAAAEEKLWELEGYNLYRNPMMECSTRESPKFELGEILPEDPKEPSEEAKVESKLGSGSAVGYSSTFTDPNLIAQLRECLGNRHIKSYGLHELVVARLAKELGGSTDDTKVNSGAGQCANNCDTSFSDALAEASQRGYGSGLVDSVSLPLVSDFRPTASELGDLLPEHPWESIPTQQVLKYVGPVAFAYVWAVTSDQQDYWTCTISLHAAPEPTPEITANGITEEVAFAAAIRTLKEMAYKNEWVLG